MNREPGGPDRQSFNLPELGAGRREPLRSAAQAGSVDLYWLPLGVGGHSVRVNGRLYEFFAARLARRESCDLYHTALEVRIPEGRYVVEQAPARRDGRARGVVAEGPIGTRRVTRWRPLRYEVRRWPGGSIPDVAEAIDSPRRLTTDPLIAQRLLDLVPEVPTLTWGRDESCVGDMWNSNSVIAWLVCRSGIDPTSIRPPVGGRAPGWVAGELVARGSIDRLPHMATPARPVEIPQAAQRTTG